MSNKNNHIFTDKLIHDIINAVFPDKRCYCDVMRGSVDEYVEAKCIGYTSSMLDNGMEYPVEVYIYDNSFDITIFHPDDYLRSDLVNLDELRGRLKGMMQVAAPDFSPSVVKDYDDFMMTFTFAKS